MNDTLLLLVNGWAGKNALVDGVGVFFAAYLIYIVFVAAVACLGYCAYRRQWRPIVYFCASLVLTFALMKLAGLLGVSHRPFMDHQLTQLIPHEPGNSFPSNHTTSSVAVALGVLLFTRFKRLGAALLGAACLIGLSRIFVGVHYPADILGGLVTALLGAGIVLGAKRFIESRTHEPATASEKK